MFVKSGHEIFNLNACENISVVDTEIKISMRNEDFGYPIADFDNHEQACQALDSLHASIVAGARGYVLKE